MDSDAGISSADPCIKFVNVSSGDGSMDSDIPYDNLIYTINVRDGKLELDKLLG